jgi:hypothetical protein
MLPKSQKKKKKKKKKNQVKQKPPPKIQNKTDAPKTTQIPREDWKIVTKGT